jgi:hypothetical protein
MRAIKYLIIISLALVHTTAWASASSVFKKNSKSVVKVVAKDQFGNEFSQGSGVVFEKFLVMTNKHVIENSFSVDVFLNGEKVPVTDIMLSTDLDIAVLTVGIKLDKATIVKELPAVGDRVYALGNPLGLDNTLSEGLISAIRGDLLQITTAISPGSSGGALLNESGDVIGITTLKAKGGENLNFAISQKAIFATKLVEYQQPEKVVSVPLISGSYLFGTTNRENEKGIKLIKKDDLLIDGNIIYASISNRISAEFPETKSSMWMENIIRIAFNCASGTYAHLSNKGLSYTNKEVFSNVVDEPKWDLPSEKNYGSPHTFICSLKKVPEDNLHDFLNTMHKGLIGDVDFMALRVFELFDPDYSTTNLTPLGQYLQSTVENFSGLNFFVDAWAESTKQGLEEPLTEN